MAESIAREVLIAVLGAAAVGAATLVWNWGTQGGAIRALGGVTSSELEEAVKRLAPSGRPGPKGDPGSQGPPGKDGSLPGIVSAFDLKDGCPIGWSPYDKGAGRFIIGAASKKEIDRIPGPFARDDRDIPIAERPFDRPGGEQQHILTISEMPSHTHRLYRNEGRGGDGLFPSNEMMGSDRRTNVADTISSGGGQAHNTMPPYVALWLCKKD